MQIPKFSLWIGVLALCGGTTLHADDTPAQAAARAALMQQLSGGQGTPAPAPQPPAAPAPVAPAPAPATAPAAASTDATPVAPQAGDNAAQAQARAALAKTMADMGAPINQTQTTAPETPIVTATIPAPAVAPVAPVAPAAAPMAMTSVDPATGDNAAQAEARAALAKTMADMGTPLNQTQTTTPVAPVAAAPAPVSAPVVAPATPVAPVAAPVATTPADPLTGDSAAQAEARAALAQKMAGMGTPLNQTQTAATAAPVVAKNGKVLPQPIPMVAPALPVSPSKEEKLKALLSRYLADQVTPEQYHEQRAAILAAP